MHISRGGCRACLRISGGVGAGGVSGLLAYLDAEGAAARVEVVQRQSHARLPPKASESRSSATTGVRVALVCHHRRADMRPCQPRSRQQAEKHAGTEKEEGEEEKKREREREGAEERERERGGGREIPLSLLTYIHPYDPTHPSSSVSLPLPSLPPSSLANSPPPPLTWSGRTQRIMHPYLE